jgi:hypothetical protein
MLQSSRPLKPELYYEMQKCLPLPKAVDTLVNLSSRAIVDYNAPKILRNVRRLKTVILISIFEIFIKKLRLKMNKIIRRNKLNVNQIKF